MSNRALVYMTVLVIAGIATLFALNLTNILSGRPAGGQAYLQPNDVRGIAVKHNQMLYTLNFNQQNQVVNIINQSIPIQEIKSNNRQRPDIEQIIIYQFGDKPDIILTPIAYVDDDLVYSAPEWNADGYLMEVSDGQLKQLISQTYDR